MHKMSLTVGEPRVGHLTAFYKDLSNIDVKDVNSQRFNKSDHDTRFWCNITVASIEWLASFTGACSQASMVEACWPHC